uniref:ULP_PROTEASE domain-containing protein n=1 Tax=Angiostrongylus cantonensis TaxID=6313 RepID=A0A0K0D8A9_ANGCA
MYLGLQSAQLFPVVIVKYPILTRADFSTLSDGEWVNDQIINFYLQLICQRSADLKVLPKVFALSTFFYLNVSTKCSDSIKRWTRNIDIFAYDLLLVPIHLEIHWCLAIVDLAQKQIDSYNSLLGGNAKCLDYLKNYLVEECEDKKKETFGFGGWNFCWRTVRISTTWILLNK